MGRNVLKDAREEEKRRQAIIESGFQLFSTYGIESVRLSDVAAKAGVGIATLYKYYENKVNLAIAISADIWRRQWDDKLSEIGMNQLHGCNAYQLIERFIDGIIWIYKMRPEILRFSGYYKNYISREGATKEELDVQLNALKPINELFYKKYDEAKVDHSIRTDIPADELFASFALAILVMAERYALGIVWAKGNLFDGEKQLLNMKDMILNWCKYSSEGTEELL